MTTDKQQPASQQANDPVAYPPDYFAAQIRKSDAKIAWQYGRIFSLAGVRQLAGQRVVDVGCGAGPGLRFLAAHGAHALGLDHSRFALATARELAPAAAVVLHDSSRDLPCAGGSADVLLLSELVEHLPDARPLLTDCRRVLRDTGCIVITTPNLWDMRRVTAPLVGKPWSGDTDPTHCNLYTPRRLAADLRASGFGRVRWHTGVKPLVWLSSRRAGVRVSVPYPPLVGNGLLAVATP